MISSSFHDDASRLRIAILLLSIAAFGSGFSLRSTDALLPRLAEEFSVSLATASNVITFFAIAYGIAQLFFGPLGDRFGKYLVIAWAAAASAVTALLCALAPDFSLLLAARLLAGATAAALIPLSMAWIGDVVPYSERQPVLARFLIGQIAGLSAGVFVGGMAADYFSWRLPFMGVAILFGVSSAALFAINRQLPEHARLRSRKQGAILPRLVSEFLEILGKPWARVVLLMVFLEGMFLYGAFAFIATHMHQEHQMSLSGAGSLVMLFGLGGFLFASNSAFLVRQLGEPGLALWGGVLMAAGLLAVAFAQSWIWAIPACLLSGVGFYMLHNTLQINATQMAPERRGAAVSAFASSFFLGQSAGVASAGLMVGSLGTGPVLITGAAGVFTVALRFRHLHAQKAAAN